MMDFWKASFRSFTVCNLKCLFTKENNRAWNKRKIFFDYGVKTFPFKVIEQSWCNQLKACTFSAVQRQTLTLIWPRRAGYCWRNLSVHLEKMSRQEEVQPSELCFLMLPPPWMICSAIGHSKSVLPCDISSAWYISPPACKHFMFLFCFIN